MIADDGRIVWMHLEGRTVERDDEGRPRRLQGIMMDVTARKEREMRLGEEATQLRSLVESMPGVPWTYAVDDPADWRPIYIAPQVEQLLGYTSAELMAEPRFFQRLVHPDDLERILALAARSIRRGEPWLAEFRIVDARRQAPVAPEQGEPRQGRSGPAVAPRDLGRHHRGAGTRGARDPGAQRATRTLTGPALSPSASSPTPTPAGTGAASREARPSRRPAGGSP